jgi:uncharacterized protein
MSKIASPCISVCKFRRDGAQGKHCIGCSMTKDQKSMFKKLKKPKLQAAFIDMLINQQAALGRYGHWFKAWTARATRKGRSTRL